MIDLTNSEKKILIESLTAINIPGKILEEVYNLKQKLIASLDKES